MGNGIPANPDPKIFRDVLDQLTVEEMRDVLLHGLPARYIAKVSQATKLLAAAGDYAAEDVMSESASAGTVWEFPDLVSDKGGHGYITKAMAFLSTTALTPRIALYLFDEAPTSALNDNVANTAVLIADRLHYQGRILLPAMGDLGGESEAIATPSTSGNLPLEFKCGPDSRSLFGIAVTRDAITGEAAGMSMGISLFAREG